MANGYIEQAINLLGSELIPQTAYVATVTAECQATLGTIQMSLGEYEAARNNLTASLAGQTRLGTEYGKIHPLMGLARLAFTQGDFSQARDLYLEVLEIAELFFDQRSTVLIHNNLSSTYEALAQITLSYHHLQTALRLCKETGDRRLTAVILNNLAYEQLRYHKQPTTAIRTYQESMEIFSNVGDLRGIAYSSYDISKAYLCVGLLQDAWSYCLRSLNTAMTLDDISLVLHALHGFANFFVESKLPERSLGLCYLIEHHPQVDEDTKNRAIVTRVILEQSSNKETIQSVRAWGENVDLQETISQIMSDNSYLPKYQTAGFFD